MKYFKFIRLFLLLVFTFTGCQSTPVEIPIPQNQPASILDLEQGLHREINLIRQRKGLLILDWDHDLKAIARQHSQEMVKMNYFDHISPSGETPTQRGLKNNYICRVIEGRHIREGIAENLFKTSLYELMAARGAEISYQWRSHSMILKNVIAKWLESPSHRKNVLHKDYQKTGIGIAINDSYEIWITQNFC